MATRSQAKEQAAILKELQNLPNVGPATAQDLAMLGITEPTQLKHRDPDQMFEELCAKSGRKGDPCMRDVFESIIAYSNGAQAQPWHAFTAGRKARDARRKS